MKDKETDKPKDKNDGGKTYGNEPPVRDPKPRKKPDHYEVNREKK